jgi:DNA polymerase I-like protein with 3'-5' exonuclease and polymerase domains
MMINYQYITDSIDDDLITKLASQRLLALDIETTCLDHFSGDIRLIQIGTANKEVYIFDHFYLGKEILKLFRIFHKDMIFLGHNLKFECLWLWALHRKYGECLDLSNCKILFDSYLASKIIFNGKDEVKHGLKDLCATYLSVQMSKEEQVSDWSQEVLTKEQLEYAAYDVYYLHDLRELMVADIFKHNLDTICKLEFDFLPVMSAIEYNGVYLNQSKVEVLYQTLSSEVIELEQQIYRGLPGTYLQRDLAGNVLGYNINLQSKTSQVLPKLLELGIGVTDLKKETLKLQHNDICNALYRLAILNKALGTYCLSMLDYVNPITNRCHTSYFQLGAVTGRLTTGSTKDENNKSKKTLPILTIPRDAKYKELFEGEGDSYLLDADYSQIESRLTAYASQCLNMLEAFNTDKDVYSVTACIENNYDYDEFRKWINEENHPKHKIAKTSRQNAKSCVLGLGFGMGVDRYQIYMRDVFNISKTREQAEKDRNSFFRVYPELSKWHRLMWNKAQGKQYIQNSNGRILYWDEPKYNVSINYGIQSLATDIMKIAYTRLFYLLKTEHNDVPLFDRVDLFPIAYIHDALTLEGNFHKLSQYKSKIIKTMENTAYEIVNKDVNKIPVMFKTEPKIGKNMAEAH